MLLSDIFYDRDDYFQAKHTLQLVLDNYANETDGIKDEARDKLAVILDAEKAKQDADEFLKMSFDEEENDEYDKLIGDEEEEAESEIEETPLNESEPEPKN